VRGRLRYMVSIPALIDLVAILPFFIGLLIGHLFDLRFFRVFRLSRLLKLSRYTGTLNTLFKAVQREQRVLFASAFMMVLLVILTASLGYELEHAAQPDKFESIPASMYWAVITLASVGYGDISPVTPLGRAMTAVISLLGIGIFAIPAGLMASAFTDQLRIDRETFENEFREALAKGTISLADQHALSAEAERLHLSKQDVDRIMYKVKQELRQHGGEGLNAEAMAQLGPDQLLERYRQQVSQLRALALGEHALRLQSALADVDNTTRSERQVWQALCGDAAN
jgi:voltage-gated potassium channel